jgi:hypothetical protein
MGKNLSDEIARGLEDFALRPCISVREYFAGFSTAKNELGRNMCALVYMLQLHAYPSYN